MKWLTGISGCWWFGHLKRINGGMIEDSRKKFIESIRVEVSGEVYHGEYLATKLVSILKKAMWKVSGPDRYACSDW